MIEIKKEELERIISAALNEDIGKGDITTNSIVPLGAEAVAKIIAKENGIVAGLFVAEAVFKKLDPDIKWNSLVNEGGYVENMTTIAEVNGSLRTILTCERTALNFLQRMSGIATQTKKYVDIIKNTKTKIMDTRKTAPGLRMLDKYSVSCGGGANHRIGLYDMILIKDNHIKAAGSITNAVAEVRKYIQPGMKIEVETTDYLQIREALTLDIDIIMLDNMTPPQMKIAVEMINGKCLTEASGNIYLINVRQVAETGVDMISVGALTHSAKALDISLEII